MKTVKILPSVNNIDFCGRVTSVPFVSKNGNVMTFTLIRNFGGNKKPVVMTFTYFKPEGGFPKFLKKGAPIVAHAYVTPNEYTDKNGEVHEEVQKVIKKVELAELVEKKISESEAIELEGIEEVAGDAVDIKED